MSAYVIGHITVKKPERWAEYRERVPATLEPWGAELTFRGTRTAVLSGNHEHDDVVVIRFPDTRSAVSWYESPAYRELIPLREEAADVELVAFETDET